MRTGRPHQLMLPSVAATAGALRVRDETALMPLEALSAIKPHRRAPRHLTKTAANPLSMDPANTGARKSIANSIEADRVTAKRRLQAEKQARRARAMAACQTGQQPT